MIRHREIPDFVYDPSLVLYLPLWKRDGGSFMSDDHYGYLATVTGATWGMQGRTFDGVDDKISIPDSDAWDFGTGAFTINLWMKNPTDDDGYLICHGGRGYLVADVVGWSLFFNATAFQWNYYHTPGATQIDQLLFAYTFDAGFHHCTLIRDSSSNMRMLVDGVQVGTTQASVANVTLSALALRIGVAYSDAEGGWLAGAIGEVTILKGQGLTDTENQAHYLATKCRYV